MKDGDGELEIGLDVPIEYDISVIEDEADLPADEGVTA